MNGEKSGRIYLSSDSQRSDRVQCYHPIETGCKSSPIDIEFKEFSSNCALGKISIKYIKDNVFRIVDICGRSSNESLHYPRSISGSKIIFSFDIEQHDFLLELAWKCSSEPVFTPNNCKYDVKEFDIRLRNDYLIIGSQFNRHPMSCLLTADAIASYNGCSENEIIWNDKDSPWYLTADTPYIISNKAGFPKAASFLEHQYRTPISKTLSPTISSKPNVEVDIFHMCQNV